MSTAVIAGATGLVGRECLNQLLASKTYTEVVALVRRPTGQTDGKLREITTDFDALHALPDELFDGADVYCCLGTTIKQAGSKAAFRRVDHDYVVNLAKTAVTAGARQFLVVSALGAAADSSIFYNRVKGEMEASVSRLPFTATHIFHPSLLTGERDEFRFGEEIGKRAATIINPLLLGPLRRYRTTPAERVAASMVQRAQQQQHGVHIHHFD